MKGELELGKYRHWKGKTYEVLHIARDSDNCLRKVVVYRSLEESDFPIGTIWIRDLEEFNDFVSLGVERFTKIEED